MNDNIEEGLSGVKGANSVLIIGPDLAKLEQIADLVMHEMDQIRGVADLGIFRVLGQPNLNIKVDRGQPPATASTPAMSPLSCRRRWVDPSLRRSSKPIVPST